MVFKYLLILALALFCVKPVMAQHEEGQSDIDELRGNNFADTALQQAQQDIQDIQNQARAVSRPGMDEVRQLQAQEQQSLRELQQPLPVVEGFPDLPAPPPSKPPTVGDYLSDFINGITLWYDELPITKIFLTVVTVLLLIFAFPIWKKLK